MYVTLTVMALLAYLAAALLFFTGLFRERPRLGAAGVACMAGGLVAQLVALTWRAVEVGPGKVVAIPDGLALGAALLVAGYLVLERLFEVRPVGSLVSPLAALGLVAVLPGSGEVAGAPGGMDVLLGVHVALAILGTVAFALAFLLALVYATQDYQLRSKRFGVLFRRLPPLDRLDQVGYGCVAVGFPIYTAAILLGFAEASRPGEVFPAPGIVLSLVTWLLFGLVLQARITAGWRGRKAALMTIAGFVAAAGVVVFYVVR